MSPLEKIDSILNFLKNKKELSASFYKEYIWSLYVSKTPELEINRQLYDEIFLKLVEEGYIRELKDTNTSSIFHLALKGLIFNGFQNQELEIIKLKRNNTNLARQMYILTFLIAIGTLIAGYFYILQIWEYYCSK